MPSWALPGFSIPTENSLELVLLQLFPSLVGLVFWVGSLTVKFSSPASQQLLSPLLIHQNTEKWNVPASTGWHHGSSPGASLKPLWATPFPPKSAFWGDAVDYIVGEKGICLGISGYEQEVTWELPQGILITEAGCCVHVDVVFVKISCSSE